MAESSATVIVDTCRQVKCEKCGKITWAVSVGFPNSMREQRWVVLQGWGEVLRVRDQIAFSPIPFFFLIIDIEI
jgi:hypothetical protein